LNPIAAESDGL